MLRLRPLLASALSLLAAGAAAAIDPAPGSFARVLPVAPDGFAGSSVNVVAGLQNTLFTHGGVQYAAFYAGDGTLVLARRALGDDAWTTARTAYRGNVNDAHNTVALAVDGEGFLHVAWDHHAQPLNYARGTAPGSLELGAKQPMTGAHEGSVTYPQFLLLPGGDLLCFYRDGRSGRGNLVLNRYAVRTRTWTQVNANLIDGEGRRSAYPAMHVDGKGVLHLAWVWRDSADVATNHDLAYARSADGGVTWTSAAGAALAVPFTAANADYALRIPPGRSLMNAPTLTADGAGQPVLADYWCPEGSDVPQYHLVRFEKTAWRTIRVTQRTVPFTLAGTATKRPPISRGVLFPQKAWRKPQEMHLVYRDDERGGRAVLASCRDLDAATPAWSFRDLTADSLGAWEPSLDPVQAGRLNQIHLLVQRVEQRDGNDREAAAVPPSPVATLIWSPYVAGLFGTHAAPDPLSVPGAPDDRALAPAEVLALGERVADWQFAQPYIATRDPRGWEIAPFYIGLLALGEISARPRFHDGMLRRAGELGWKAAPRTYFADDYCVAQAYLRLHRRHREPKMLATVQAQFDGILAKPSPVTLDWGLPNCTDRWSWCDALFMGPAGWTMLTQITGDARYAAFAHREWQATTDKLYRPPHGWFARDESFLDLREPNGKPIFWARGNGWVVAGLCHVLETLAPDAPERTRYVAQYREMMAAALAAQQPDGLWRPGLLDPAAHPAREASGSSFMTFALAYGVNRGLLDRAQVEPAVRRAWNALAKCVNADGKLEHVQPIGAAPEGFDPHHNDWFGAGAFLLATTEVFRLAGGAAPAR